jgi:peptidoglycan hydrolase CwlO-like protein
VERLSARIRGIYTEEPPTLVEIVLASGGLTAAVDTQRAIEAIGDQDARIVAQLQEARARLTRLRAELQGDRAAVEASVSESASRLAELRGLIADRRGVLDDAQATLDQLVAGDRERRAARVAAAEAAAERALLRRADPTQPAAADPAPAPTGSPAPATTEPAAPASGGVSAVLARIAQCESGGNPRAVSASGQYRGKYQFDLGTWQSLGGTGDPAAASEAEQDRLAALLYAQRGPAPWPVCGYR